MNLTRKESLKNAKLIYDQHLVYWDKQRPQMKNLMDMYNCDFWNERTDKNAMVQVPDGRQQVESYINSLFSKAPSVKVSSDIRATTGSPATAEAVINRFLENEERIITEACRMSLIWPCSFIEVRHNGGTDPLDSIVLELRQPQNVILDYTASSWDQQRWVGLVSQIPLTDAVELYGSLSWEPRAHVDYLNSTSAKTPAYGGFAKTTVTDVSSSYLFVTIVELFDFIMGEKITWSPDLSSNEGYIKKQPAMQNSRGQMCVPIVPVYLHTDPSHPL